MSLDPGPANYEGFPGLQKRGSGQCRHPIYYETTHCIYIITYPILTVISVGKNSEDLFIFNIETNEWMNDCSLLTDDWEKTAETDDTELDWWQLFS